MKTINLYHFSNLDFSDKIRVKHYGENYWTNNDKNITNVRRSFFYLENKALEYRFKNARFLYKVKIQKGRLYDLRADKRGYIKIYENNINRLLWKIKQQYDGVIYQTGGIDIVNLFYDKDISEKISLFKG